MRQQVNSENLGKGAGKRINKKMILYISIAVLTVLFNVIAWNSTAFCDAYIAYVFPVWVNTYGRFTGLFSFSVGEWLLVAGVLLVVVAVLLGIVWGAGKVCHMICAGYRHIHVGKQSVQQDAQKKGTAEKQQGVLLQKIVKGYYHFFAWVLLIVCVIMSLNCFVLYHASTFSYKYFGEDTREYGIEDVLKVYNIVVEQCNALSQQMERTEDGTIIYLGVDSAGNPADMEEKAIEAMQQLGKTYPQLDGYYPRPKAMMFSDFMCQQYMCGYYFPFSMEANYNDVMYVMNKPASMCHELAHLRGYIYEDEANFISYLACVESDDVTFRYAGYLSVLNYLINDLYKAYRTQPAAYAAALEAVEPIPLLAVVQEDNVFVTEEEWDRINGKAVLDTETVDEMSDTFTDTTLKLNGVSDGMLSYSRVVKLLLQYYNSDNS